MPDYVPLKTVECGIKTEATYISCSEKNVVELAAAGILPYRIFADTRSMNEGQIRKALGKCRFVARSLEELYLINRIAFGEIGGQPLTAVGLYLLPDAYDHGANRGIKEKELPTLTSELKKLSAISVQGCFVEDCTKRLYGKELGKYFRNCYELAKRMTVILPCSMPYLGIMGVLDAINRNLREQPETIPDVQRAAEIVSMQNQTAFYAKLLVT